MKNFPKVFLVVLNYNGKESVLDCLKSVYRSDYPDFEVVVVDNNSTDGSLEMAKRDFSKAHFIKNNRNLGFSAGNNVGIRFSLEKFADYVLLLNNDACLEKNTVSLLVEEAEKSPGAGILSPLILQKNGQNIWFAGGHINWLTMKTRHEKIVVSQKPYPCGYITGCSMLVKKNVFKKIGLLDEDFFLYYEDADFSFRTKKAGFSLLLVPAAKVLHAERSETNNAGKLYWLVLSGLLFFRKNSPFYLKPWLFCYLTLRKTKNFFSFVFNKNTLNQQVRKAYKDFGKYSR